MACFTQRAHPGHRHVHAIEVCSEYEENEVRALGAAKNVLPVLPKDGLWAFR